MRGHVLRRGSTWSWIVDVGRDPVTGKRRQQMKGGFLTRREAERALAQVVGEVHTGTHVSPDPQTVGEWIDRWLPTMASKIRPSTWRDYEYCLERVSDRLGHVKLQELTPLQIEELYARLLSSGHRRGGALAPKTVRNVHIALRRSLADAERFGLVPRNVAALVNAPRATRAEMSTWSAEEVRQFLDFVADDRLAAVFRLIITTGMRRGEALGLRWSDIDLAGGRVSINRSLTDAPRQARLVGARRPAARAGRSRSMPTRSNPCGLTASISSRSAWPPARHGRTTTSCSATRTAP